MTQEAVPAEPIDALLSGSVTELSDRDKNLISRVIGSPVRKRTDREQTVEPKPDMQLASSVVHANEAVVRAEEELRNKRFFDLVDYLRDWTGHVPEFRCGQRGMTLFVFHWTTFSDLRVDYTLRRRDVVTNLIMDRTISVVSKEKQVKISHLDHSVLVSDSDSAEMRRVLTWPIVQFWPDSLGVKLWHEQQVADSFGYGGAQC